MEVRARATGIGIPEQYLPPGVERFGLSDKAGLGELGGTGLGLSIGQWIASGRSVGWIFTNRNVYYPRCTRSVDGRSGKCDAAEF